MNDLNKRTMTDSLDGVAQRWEQAYERLQGALTTEQQEAVDRLISRLHSGGAGLRAWLEGIAWRKAVLPARIPPEVIEVYLRDPEAMPLYACEDCGLSLPVRPSHLGGFDAEPERVYFTGCPHCGGRTGAHAFHAFGARPISSDEPPARPKPR